MAIALDQNLGFSGTSTTQITVSGTFPAGALILVAVGFATATSGQSLSQNGNAFTTLFTRENSATNNLVYYYGYIKNWAGGALSTTFTLSGAGKDAGARLLSFTGVDTTAPLLLSHDAGGAPKSTTMDSGAATGTTNPDDLLVGFFTWSNTSDISGTITEGTTPASGWNITAHSNGSSANTPHGQALFTWQILAGSAVTNPDASVTFTTPSAGVSWGASIATFKAASGGTVNASATLDETFSAGVTTGSDATLTETFSGAAQPGANALLSETFSGAAQPGSTALLSETFTGAAQPGMWALLDETFSGQSTAGARATLDETFSAVVIPTVEVMTTATLDAVFSGQAQPGANASLDAVFSGQSTPGATALLLAMFSGSATAQTIFAGPLVTPAGTIADGVTPAGSIAAGSQPSGSIQAATVPGGTIVAGVIPAGGIVSGKVPGGTIVRD